MNQQNRRRPTPHERHTLSVHVVAERLIVLCRCGKTVGGKRMEDRRAMSLIDLIELIRIHSQEVDRGMR